MRDAARARGGPHVRQYCSVWSTYILPKRHDLGFDNDGAKCKQRAVPGPGPSDANNAVEVKADDQAAAVRKAFYY